MIKFLKSLFTNKNSNSFCPYCKNKLDVRPERKKKCPFCNEYIFVRTDPLTKEKVLVSKLESHKIDKKWEEIYMVKKWKLRLLDFGITENDFNFEKSQRNKNGKILFKDKDVIWSLFNKATSVNAIKGDFQLMKQIYYSMALFLGESGKDPFTCLQQSAKMELTFLKSTGLVSKVFISTGHEKSCVHCQQLEGKTFTIDEAVEQQPIPCKDCTYKLFTGMYGFCRCQYSPVGSTAEDRDNYLEQIDKK